MGENNESLELLRGIYVPCIRSSQDTPNLLDCSAFLYDLPPPPILSSDAIEYQNTCCPAERGSMSLSHRRLRDTSLRVCPDIDITCSM